MKRFSRIGLATLLSLLMASSLAVAQPHRPGGPGGPGGQGGPGGPEQGEMAGPMHDGFERDCFRGGPLERLAAMLPDEVRDAGKAILMEHRKAQYPLRERIQAKQHELNALIATPNVSNDAITKLVEEINGLRAEKFRAEVAMRKEFFKVTGVPLPDKPRFGRM